MSDIIITLHPENNSNENLYPNIKPDNIENKSINFEKLNDDLLNSYNLEFMAIEVNFENGYVDRSGNINSGFRHKTYNVIPNTLYWFNTYFDSTYQPTIVYFDNTNSVIKYERLATMLYFNKILTPSNCVKIIINCASSLGFTNLFKINKVNIRDLKLNKILNNSFISGYSEINDFLSFNGLLKTNNSMVSNNEYVLHYLNVVPLQKYKFYTDVGGDNYSYIILDNDGNVIDTYLSTSFNLIHHEIEMPFNASLLIYCLRGTRVNIIETTSKYVSELSDNFESEIFKKNLINEQLKNDFAWKEFNQKYITITIDDSNADISDLENLAEELNIPLCFATIPSKLSNTCLSGETVKQVLNRAILNGGEILSHYSSPLTSASTDNDYKIVYIDTLKELYDNGFDVNGIITTGGANYQTQNFEKDINIARLYYKYADLTATGYSDVEQYYNPRRFMDGGVTSCKNIIDSVNINGKGWVNFATHGYLNGVGVNMTNINDFREVFEYALSKGFTFITWNNLYNRFRSSKLEKKIDLLSR